MSTFIRGTAILMIAVFMSKLLGFVYRIQFMRVAGEEAVGIYMTAYPAFIFFLSLVQLGVPIAVAKVIAELKVKGETAKLSAVMRTATFITIFTGAIFIPLSILIHPVFIGNLIGQCSLFHYTLCRNRHHSDCCCLWIDPWIFSRDCQNRRNSMVPNHRTTISDRLDYLAIALSARTGQ